SCRGPCRRFSRKGFLRTLHAMPGCYARLSSSLLASEHILEGAMTNRVYGHSGARALTRRTALKGALGATLAGSGFGIIGKASAGAVTMRFGSASPMASPHAKSAVVFKEIVEKNTQGRVQVDI